MENNLRKAKRNYLIFGIIMFIVLLAALVFMTQYRFIRVNVDPVNGITETAELTGYPQRTLFKLFEVSGKTYESGFPEYLVTENQFYDFAEFVYGYRLSLDAFNDLILTFAIIGLISFGILLVFANHTRRVYYKSNLIAGVALPLVTFVFSIVLIIQDISLMLKFNQYFDLFNLVSVGQNPINVEFYRKNTEWETIRSAYDCNSTTFIIYIALFTVVAAYSVYMIAYAISRYKASAEDRKNILTKAGVIND